MAKYCPSSKYLSALIGVESREICLIFCYNLISYKIISPEYNPINICYLHGWKSKHFTRADLIYANVEMAGKVDMKSKVEMEY